jgi:hypothetical protein
MATPEIETPVQFTSHDRCDRCNAQAKARVTMESGNDLLFCGHHTDTLEAVLVAQGGRIERGAKEYAGTPGAST